jgi:radical SAM protein with 4Fe4S-binding SPASM domain
MLLAASVPVSIRPNIGVRRFGKNLCLINQRASETWVCSGSSMALWERLSRGWTPQDISDGLTARANIAPEIARRDVMGFVEQLWQRRIIDVAGMEHVTDVERAGMVKEKPHNKSGILVRSALANNVMFQCIFDLLVPCNLRCRHCYLDFSIKDIMPFNEVCNYLDQLAEHGCPALTFTGGEIFLRKDLMDIVGYASQKGFSILLLTNGNFIDEKRADELARLCVERVQISIYGTTARTHELVTRKAGTFDQSMAAARMLIDRGVRVLLSYFVQHDNVEEAFGFEDFCEAMGAESKFDTKLVPNRNGSKELLQYAVTMQQMAELFRRGIMGYETDFLCTAAVGKVRITANAEVYPCELINTASMGNLKQQSLSEIWNAQRRQTLRTDILNYKPNRCKSCSHTSDCEPCAAMRGFNQPDHMEAPVSEACFLTTANLLSKGKNITDSNLVQQTGNECVSSLLNGEASSKHSTLVQIMVARTADAPKQSEQTILQEARAN